MTPVVKCPSVEALRRSLDPDSAMTHWQRQTIEQHVEHCDQGCKSRLEALLRGSDLIPAATPLPWAIEDDGASPPAVPGYDILEELGRGGMGVVYKARHLALGRIVALKQIQGGPQVSPADLQRFRTEAEAVARLRHPNVVQIHDVGDCGGLPYLTLEFCPGGSLASKLNGTPLPPQEAARLAELLPRGLQAAHGEHVIHRDLKPHNVLFTEDGTPKITDFGLAKKLDTTGQQTQTGVILGTPSYMAPEQARGDLKAVGPLADVYGLGATLYEMLTGRPPFKATTPMDTAMQVLAEDPVSPRRLQPQTPRDLETICLKCLHKEPAKRYGSALALAEDLRRFQAGEPIQARPLGLLERSWRWCRRQPALAATGAGAVLALVLLLVTLTVAFVLVSDSAENALKLAGEEHDARLEVEKQKKAAIFQRDKAREYFAKAQESVDKMLTRVSQDKDLLRYEPRMEEIRRKLLDDALVYYQGFLKEKSDDPGLRKATAFAYMRLGYVQKELGMSAKAEYSFREALKLRQQLADDFPKIPEYRSDLASSHNNLGYLLGKVGRTQEEEEAHREALKLRQQLADDYPKIPEYRSDLANSQNNLGYLLRQVGRPHLAEEAYREALKFLQRLADDFPKIPEYRSDLARSHNNLGVLLGKMGRAQGEEEAHREALKLRQQLADDYPKIPEYRSDLASSHNNLGYLLEEVGRAQEAEEAHREALKLQKQLADDYPKIPEYRSNLARSHNNLGYLLRKVGRPHPAEEAYREALKLRQQLANDFPKVPEYRSDLAHTHNNLGYLLEKVGRVQEGEEAYQVALKLLKQLADDFPKLPDYRSDLAATHTNLGVFLKKAGRFRETEQAYREALKLRQQLADDFPKIPKYRSNLADSHDNLAILLEKTGRPKEAEVALREALKVQKQLADDFPKITRYRNTLANLHKYLGSLLKKLDRLPDAEEFYRAGLNLRKQLVVEDPKNFANREELTRDYHRLAFLLEKRNRLPEAETLYHSAIALGKQLVEERPKDATLQGDLAVSLSNLSLLIRDLARLAEAKTLMEQAITHHRAALALAPEHVGYRNGLARNHTSLADILVRLKNHPAATQAAAEVLRIAPTDWQPYQRGALFTCQAIALAAKDDQLADPQRKGIIEGYSVQAMRLLQQAVQQGYTNAAALKKEPAFAPLRDRPDFQKLLKALSFSDRLWADLLDAKQAARYQFAETKHQGALTAQNKAQTHPLELKAGVTYVLDAESKQFDTMLRLHDLQGKELAFNDDISPKNLNSRIIFTAAQGGPYRVVVTSYQEAGTGAYLLRVRELVKGPAPK